MLVLYLALDELYILLIIAAVGCLLDELVFDPLHARYKAQATINAQLDKRIGA